MTTLKDYLNDFAEEIKKFDKDTDVNWEHFKEDKIEDLLKVVVERLIGE